MLLKGQFIFDVTQVIGGIMARNAPMPLKGKFRLERLHAKLMIEFTPLNDKRTAMITAYDHRREINGVDQVAVPLDKIDEFNKAWDETYGQQDIEVPGAAPIPLALFDLGDHVDGGVTALELRAMGDLVVE